MATVPEIIASLNASADRADTSSEQMYDVANGPASGPGSTVTTDSGPVPTLSKWFADNQAAINAQANLESRLRDNSDALRGAAIIAYNAALSYAAGTVGFELNKRKSVFATGNATVDLAAINATIAAAPANTVVEFFGNFTTNASIVLKPQVWLKANGAKFTHTNAAADFIAYTPGTPTGFPGKIVIEGFEVSGPGNTGSSNFVRIDANAPYVFIKQCYVGQFFGFAYLRDCYNAIIEQCAGYGFSHGIRLLRESHSFTWINSLIDGCTIAGLSVNYGGGAGTGPLHNVNLLGGAIQNSAVGVWAENCLGLHTVGLYHEGNTVNDYRIGIADAGAYARACYNVVIDGFETSSPCASGRNIRIEHTVGCQIRAAAFNSGCSTTATLVSYDGFSSRVLVNMHRYTTTTPSATAPLDFTVDPTRGVAVFSNREIHGAGVADAISAGTLASKLWTLGHQNFGGRDAAQLKSFQDVILQVGTSGVIKFRDASGTDVLTFQFPLPTSAGAAGSGLVWKDAGSGNVLKVS